MSTIANHSFDLHIIIIMYVLRGAEIMIIFFSIFTALGYPRNDHELKGMLVLNDFDSAI